MRTKFYNFQARVSKKNTSKEDFNFLEDQLANGNSMSALAREALTLLRKHRNGELVDITKLPNLISKQQINNNKNTNEIEKEIIENMANGFNI